HIKNLSSSSSPLSLSSLSSLEDENESSPPPSASDKRILRLGGIGGLGFNVPQTPQTRMAAGFTIVQAAQLQSKEAVPSSRGVDGDGFGVSHISQKQRDASSCSLRSHLQDDAVVATTT
ncbi:hypothetical protein L914_03638, partial [Phytophthora nicotianae]